MSKYVVANWKQNNTLDEVESWVEKFNELIKDKTFSKVKIIVAPSFPHLHKIKELAAPHDFLYCSAQNVSEETGGRHTGEVSAAQLADYSEYCILGHSETGEQGEKVFQKGTLCIEAGIDPIICFVDKDNPPEIPGVILAWEDPENITKEDGVYNAKSSDSVREGLVKVKSKLGDDAKVLYGGSVNRQNASELSNIDELDGVLVGSASLDPEHFFAIVTAFEK